MEPEVLIVGAGPVGMSAATELSRFGIPLRTVDKAAQRTDKSKALVLWSRTLELLNRGPKGATPFIEAGFKATAVNLLAGIQRCLNRRFGRPMPSRVSGWSDTRWLRRPRREARLL
jgi:flavin-dependent dehydrogenase